MGLSRVPFFLPNFNPSSGLTPLLAVKKQKPFTRGRTYHGAKVEK